MGRTKKNGQTAVWRIGALVVTGAGRWVLAIGICLAVFGWQAAPCAPADGGQATATPTPATPVQPEPPAEDTLAQAFITIQPGTFTMGTDFGDDNEKPTHRVTLTQPFELGKYEVTQRQWQAVMSTAPWRGQQFAQDGDQYPAMFLSRDAVMTFITRLNAQDTTYHYRLPTEAEWEYAARAGTDDLYAGTSDPDSLCLYGNVSDASAKREFPRWKALTCDDGFVWAAPVGSFRPNAWGLHDMTGNVWEWLADHFAPYPAEAVTDPRTPTGEHGMLRGNSFDAYADVARLTNRFPFRPEGSSVLLGFRLVRARK